MDISSSTIDEEIIIEKVLQALGGNGSIIPDTHKTESIDDMLASEEIRDAINHLF